MGRRAGTCRKFERSIQNHSPPIIIIIIKQASSKNHNSLNLCSLRASTKASYEETMSHYAAYAAYAAYGMAPASRMLPVNPVNSVNQATKNAGNASYPRPDQLLPDAFGGLLMRRISAALDGGSKVRITPGAQLQLDTSIMTVARHLRTVSEYLARARARRGSGERYFMVMLDDVRTAVADTLPPQICQMVSDKDVKALVQQRHSDDLRLLFRFCTHNGIAAYDQEALAYMAQALLAVAEAYVLAAGTGASHIDPYARTLEISADDVRYAAEFSNDVREVEDLCQN